MNIAGKHHVLGLERKSLGYSDPKALWTKIKNLTALFSHKRELYASKEVKENAVASEGKLPCWQRSLTTRPLLAGKGQIMETRNSKTIENQ